MKMLPVVALGAALIGVGACSNAIKAPYDQGVCYYVVPADDPKAEPRYNVVARDQPQLEACAARLEEMRLRFLGLGGSNRNIMGSYQGQFIFIDGTGVKVSKTMTGGRFFLLARTGDGRLAMPGAIVRDETGRPIAVAASPESPAPAN